MAIVAACGLAAQARAAGLTPIGNYDSPVFVTSDPSNPDRLFVVEQTGKIELTTPAGTSAFVDLTSVVASGGERGLLSMAFAPDFATSGRVYVYYTGTDNGSIHVGELTASGDRADASTLRDVITIAHPAGNHNGGQVAFGPDGYLYLATGDGGGANDTANNAQSLGVLLGKMLRIDPKPDGGYAVPPDNPFVGTAAARPEIWSYGLRNPYRFSFDRGTGALAIGDVGQGAWEEVDYATQPNGGRGVNYGWSCREGKHDANGGGCAPPASTDPVLEYSHQDSNCSITGGYVVRDPGLPGLAGRYVYADFCKGQVRSAVLATGGASDDRSEGIVVSSPSSFGQDSCGRIYVTSLGGEVARIEGSTPTDCTAVGDTPPAVPPAPTGTDPAAKDCTATVRGTRGKDVLRGGSGSQRILGIGGRDRLFGGDGDDCVIGGRGADRLNGGAGRDVLRGGRGHDVIFAQDGVRDRVSCGKGRDRVRADRIDRVRGCEKIKRRR